jgi:Glycosyl hydrolases family 16
MGIIVFISIKGCLRPGSGEGKSLVNLRVHDYMKTSLLAFCIAISTIALAANTAADQQLGAQVRTKQAFGMGRLVMDLKPSTEKGIVNGFFMLKYQEAFPNGWTEIDYEYVPGNRDSGRKTAEGNCGPGGSPCTVSVLDGQSAADFISVNIIAGPLNGGPPGDSQVFYKFGQNFIESFQSWEIYTSPGEVRWNLPSSGDFMYQQQGNNTNDIHQSRGVKYLDEPGRAMYIWFNIYSGLGEGFGGPTIPKQNTEMVVRSVRFYPLVRCDGTFCYYSPHPSLDSDFQHGIYQLNGIQSTFDAIWLNEDSTVHPVYTRAANASVIPGEGLVMKYTYTP